MKNQLFLSIALLVSAVGTIGAMQPKDVQNLKVKELIHGRGTITAVLLDGRRISLDPSIKWQSNSDGTVSRLNSQAPVAAPAAQQAPAVVKSTAPVAQVAAAAATAQRIGKCHGNACQPKPFVVNQGGTCTAKPFVVKQSGCKNGVCPMPNMRRLNAQVVVNAPAAPQAAPAPQASVATATVASQGQGPVTYHLPGGTITVNGPHRFKHHRHVRFEVTQNKK